MMKTGNAILSGYQEIGYYEIGAGTVTGVGGNAKAIDLFGALPADTPVVILRPE